MLCISSESKLERVTVPEVCALIVLDTVIYDSHSYNLYLSKCFDNAPLGTVTLHRCRRFYQKDTCLNQESQDQHWRPSSANPSAVEAQLNHSKIPRQMLFLKTNGDGTPLLISVLFYGLNKKMHLGTVGKNTTVKICDFLLTVCFIVGDTRIFLFSSLNEITGLC